MSNYVLVHGAWVGGWTYDGIAEKLRNAGHNVVVAQLAGLGSRASELNPSIDLSQHIGDVSRQIEDAEFDRFILVGHSYGGMVITGLAAHLGARIDAIVYIDAFLPGNDQSLWDITGEFEHKHYIDSQKRTPGLVAPIMGAGHPGITRHPLLTLIEAVRITGENKKIPRHIYIFATGWEPTPFRRFYEAVRNDPIWEVHLADSGHDVMSGQPEQLLAILLGCAS
jgi:pimeloyl-ACP methyl ester carboxylesterase